jgi:hypothetical protein
VVNERVASFLRVDPREASMRRRSAALAAALAASVVLADGGRAQQSSQAPAPQWPYVHQGRGVCYTQTGWCPINGNLPVGVACYCTIPPNTHIYGIVTAHEYRGHVNPFFNPHTFVPGTIR